MKKLLFIISLITISMNNVYATYFKDNISDYLYEELIRLKEDSQEIAVQLERRLENYEDEDIEEIGNKKREKYGITLLSKEDQENYLIVAKNIITVDICNVQEYSGKEFESYNYELNLKTLDYCLKSAKCVTDKIDLELFDKLVRYEYGYNKPSLKPLFDECSKEFKYDNFEYYKFKF